MRIFLVLMTVLCLGAAVQAYEQPIPNLPTEWGGQCYHAIPDPPAPAGVFMPNLDPGLADGCWINHVGHLWIVMTMADKGGSRVPMVEIGPRPLWSDHEAPVSLRFPDGALFIAPRLHYGPLRPYIGFSQGWRGRDAQEIIRYLKTSSSVELRFRPSVYAVLYHRLPREFQGATFSLAHFATAWKALTDAVYALPVLHEESPPRPSPILPKIVTPRR